MAFRDPVLIKRSRRRRRLIVLSVFAVIVAVLALAFRYQSERRQTIEFLNEARSIAEEHQEMSLLLADLFANLGDAEREEILTRLDTLSGQAGAIDDRVEALVVTNPVAEANGQLVVAHRAWKSAIDSAGPVIIQVLDAVDDERNADLRLRETFVRLLVGDQAYADLLTTLGDLEVDVDPFPAFAYVGAGRLTLYDADFVGEQLRALTSLVESHDVAITVKLDPEPAGSSDGVQLVPNNGSFQVLVVVSNNSNVQEAGIEVLLQMRPEEGEPIMVSELVPSLEPGESVSVDFRELEVVVGVAYEVLVAATVAEDSDPGNNSTELVFAINSDS